MSDAVAQAREAYERRAWAESFEGFVAADQRGDVAAPDLELFARAAYLSGNDAESEDAWARAHRAYLEAGDRTAAARCAFRLGWDLILRGDSARSSGWLRRAERLAGSDPDEVVRGYLLVPAALELMEAGDARACHDHMERAIQIAERNSDPDLMALARLTLGEALIEMGSTAEGLGFLDETMISVTAEEVAPDVAGLIYCAVLLACRRLRDVRRAQEWTEALTGWCDSQPQMVPFRGSCLVHRSEVMALRGDWLDALVEIGRACEWLADHPSLGDALYQRAELFRLQGRFSEAESDYRRAGSLGAGPQPGLALMRLAQGRIDDAVAAIRPLAEEMQEGSGRPHVLAAYVEIMLAAGAVDVAREAADELRGYGEACGTEFIRATSSAALGSVLLAEGEAARASDVLRDAWSAFRDLGAAYEMARVRVLLASALSHLGDEDTAAIEIEAARWAFEQLGATPDLERLPHQVGVRTHETGLTEREVEVLVQAASGKSNKEIAAVLSISEHTVRRHLQNIFSKIGVTSRSAATAYAFRHHLV